MHIEPLEARIAPAAMFVSPTTATYIDVDGDHITVTFSKPILDNANVTAVLVTAASGVGEQLQRIELGGALAAPPSGTSITLKAVPTATAGDGAVNVGIINSAGVDLGAVSIPGDLGKITAGDGTTKSAGLKSLTVRSFGAQGTATGAPDLNSSTNGGLGALTVKGSMVNAVFNANGGVDGKIGAVTIGVSLDGGTIKSAGDMGKVKVGRDVVGGSGIEKGSIISGGKIAAVTIGGSIIGGGSADTGSIHSAGDMGKVSVGRDVIGIFGDRSGSIISDKKMGDVFVGGSLQGTLLISNAFSKTAYISSGLDMGKVTIAQEVFGGGAPSSGLIKSGGKIASVSIGGSLTGGFGTASGRIESVGSIKTIKIGADLAGSVGASSGSIECGDLGLLRIGGDLTGGSANESGTISANNIGTLAIVGSLQGGSITSGTLDHSGVITAANIKLLTIGGSFIGGSNQNGTLSRSGYIEVSGTIKTFTLTGDFLGSELLNGTGTSSGVAVLSAGTIEKMSIGGTLKGTNNSGTGSVTDGGEIVAQTIKKLTIGGSLQGGFTNDGELTHSGMISASVINSLTIRGDLAGDDTSGSRNVNGSGAIVASHIDSLFIGGSITTLAGASGAGTNTATSTIQIAQDIKSLTIRGSLVGSANNPVIISAFGQAAPGGGKDLAIGSITIGGDVEFANILAGYNTFLAPTNGSAQIGKVSVVGNWSASNLVAGVMNAASGNTDFGDANDATVGGTPGIIAKIAAISIGGTITGTTAAGDHFGFAAPQIGSFILGGTAIPLAPAPFTRDIGPTGDVSIHLV